LVAFSIASQAAMQQEAIEYQDGDTKLADHL
jgi:hypothetical protein